MTGASTWSPQVTWVGEVPVAVTDIPAVVEHLCRSRPTGGSGAAVRLISAKEVAGASGDERYRRLLSGPGVNVPDGTPVLWTMRFATRKSAAVPGRVRGATLFRAALDAGRQDAVRHFFLGSTSTTLDKLTKSARTAYPGVNICGVWSPPFAPLDEQFYERALDELRRAEPDVVWVGLGAPKQDYAVTALAAKSDLTFVAVGAAFDFLAGEVREAPKAVQAVGLEWLFRLVMEPRRLWRRYLIGNATFIVAVLRSGCRRAIDRRAVRGRAS